MLIKSFKYRIYPTEKQKELIEKHFGCTRWVFNFGLERKMKSYDETGKSESTYSIQKDLAKMKNVLRCDRFDSTSKICSSCGWKKEELTLKDREWVCEGCNKVLDRDTNAAINIKNFCFK